MNVTNPNPAQVQRQIKLPLSKAVEIAYKNIRMRLSRSLLVTSGIFSGLDPAVAAGIGDRLHADETGRRAGRGVSIRTGDPRGRIQRRARDGLSRGDRGEAPPQRGQGRGRHQRAWNGLRQVRPGVRRPLPGARLGDLLLPADWPGGARRRPRRDHPAARRRGSPHPGLLHRAGVSGSGAGCRGDERSGGRGRERSHHPRADGGRQPRDVGSTTPSGTPR